MPASPGVVVHFRVPAQWRSSNCRAKQFLARPSTCSFLLQSTCMMRITNTKYFTSTPPRCTMIIDRAGFAVLTSLSLTGGFISLLLHHFSSVPSCIHKVAVAPLILNLNFPCPIINCCCNFFCPKAGPLLSAQRHVTAARQIAYLVYYSIRAPICDQKFRTLILVTRHSSPWLAMVCTCVPLPTDCLRPFVIRFLQPFKPDFSRCHMPHARVSHAPPPIAPSLPLAQSTKTTMLTCLTLEQTPSPQSSNVTKNGAPAPPPKNPNSSPP